MKELLILGAGTAGTIMANHLSKKLNPSEWSITIIDQSENHYYQPGFLFLPFDIYSESDVIKKGKKFLPKNVKNIQTKIKLIEPEKNKVLLANNVSLDYDILIIATGSDIAPDEVDGMLDGWRKDIFDFYTYEGSLSLRNKLRTWDGGKLVVHISEMPIKCPVAPLEFAFLADWYFSTKKKIRDRVEIIYVTPLDNAFTKQKTSEVLGPIFKSKNIKLITNFNVSHVEADDKKLVSLDGRAIDYDLLVTVPPNMGDSVIEESDLGDELNFVPTHKHTLQSKSHKNIFVIGDATDLPASKAGSVVHFEAEILTENIISYINGKPLSAKFDGHSNCFIETGYDKAILIDFNYDYEPVKGTFPLQGIGPLKLLEESKVNHLGKLAFKYVYWHMLLRGIPIPMVPANMSLKGKKL
ncbi:MAG: FAD-dependent pyridine nucleotide-disulfide oxidoreductase [Bacillales bacterium]|jgi:sulfide:quinone oxidoreductase|nr:FAD-dependent pyridine nucleotide-disulfide oxidoreductase [Bacillales bacterium]